jgi:glycine cleavage system H lipoate-binding protein
VFLVAALALAVPALLAALAWRALRRRASPAVERGHGFSWRRGAYHASNHTWLAPRAAGELALGLDDLAQALLPSVTSVELPRPGVVVQRGEPIAVVRAGSRAIRIEAPISGLVVRPNHAVQRDPELVKREPYGAGWLFSLAPADASYMRFPVEGEARDWLAGEERRLQRALELELGIAAADGGTLLVPPLTALGEEGWRRVVGEFLRVR